MSTPDSVFIRRSGLDAYFFLRFLRTLLKLFIPLALVVLPILIPLNIVSGYSGKSGVRGLDRLSWTDVNLAHWSYYWAHLFLALGTITYFCFTVYREFSECVRIRQEYLVSPSHRSQASAKTVFFTGIPNELLFTQQLSKSFKDIAGGVRDVWINQDYTDLLSKVQKRDKVVALLEAAETSLIAKAIRAHGKKGYNNRCWTEDSIPLWKQYLREKDRECMRLPIFGLAWVSGIPFLGRKVDTIEYCRQELAHLNTEIENDQQDTRKYRLLNSAFVQFHSQKAAHTACQITAYWSPLKVVPQCVDVSPEDVIWESLYVKCWGHYIRKCLIIASIIIIILGWSVPIAFTGLLSQITYLVAFLPWLKGLERLPNWMLGFIRGVLPQSILMILLTLLPITVRLLAQQRGSNTRMSVELAVQRYYFSFLFLQVFLTVSLSSSVTTIIGDIFIGLDSVPSILASNLPKTSNYFFSYLLLQAFSISADGLAQVTRLLEWLFIARIMDRTPREKWKREVNLPKMQWGTIYPMYTNLACIGTLYR